ncbi:hypothetical protein FOFC_20870 [Fusarium oxysporum]|nr:hypothetical protein FOFC_20870 [Fusarium oxysporum]
MKDKTGCFERACSPKCSLSGTPIAVGEPCFSGAPVRRGNQNTVLRGAHGRGLPEGTATSHRVPGQVVLIVVLGGK